MVEMPAKDKCNVRVSKEFSVQSLAALIGNQTDDKGT